MSSVPPAIQAQLRTVVESGPTPLFATVSGAHLYGFESPDSDWDLRGAFVAPLREVIGLVRAEETVSILEEQDGIELDWVAHDVVKFVGMLTKRNGYVLEQIMSPLVVHGGAWYEELRELAGECLVRPLVHHYKGFAHNQRQLLESGDTTVKRLLYCYRVLLTGVHALRAGRIESHLPTLLEAQATGAKFEVMELIERKREGAEYGALEPGEAERHTQHLDALMADLADAYESSALPEKLSVRPALHDFVVRARLELGSD